MRISDWSSDGCSSDLPSRQRSGTTDGFPRIAVPPRLRNSGRIPSMDHGMTQQPITLIGGGMVGALLAQKLAQRGFAIEVFEKRDRTGVVWGKGGTVRGESGGRRFMTKKIEKEL